MDNFKWSTEYSECSSDLRAFIPRASTRPMGMGLPRSSWVRLNRLQAVRWALSVVHAQMGPCSYIELRVWRCRTNRRTHHSDMPRTSGTHRNTWTDGFGYQHTILAEYYHCQHLISKQMDVDPFQKKEEKTSMADTDKTDKKKQRKRRSSKLLARRPLALLREP